MDERLNTESHEFVVTHPNWADRRGAEIPLISPEGEGWFYVETVGVGVTGPGCYTVWARERRSKQAYR